MINTLCIGSGGIKGISYIGALLYLEKNNYITITNIQKYTGVSAGCLLCILLVVGYKIDEIYNIINVKDINELKPDITLDLIIEKYGFDDGEKIINYFKKIIFLKLKYNNNDISFIELYKITNKELYIATTNFSKNTEKIFSFKETPNISIFLAIRMSISIPLIYTPVLFENNYYVDGALTNNVYILENSDPKKTLVLYINKFVPTDILSIKDIIIGSILIMCDQIIQKNLKKYNCLKINYINIIFSSEIYITNKILDLLFLNGKKSAKKFLKKQLKIKIDILKNEIINKKKHIIKDILNNIIIKIENE